MKSISSFKTSRSCRNICYGICKYSCLIERRSSSPLKYKPSRMSYRKLRSFILIIFNIYWFKMTNDTACNLTLHCDTDDDNNADAGEIVCQQAVVADGGIATSMGELPFISAIGGKPHILASASGNVSCHLIGYIVTDG